MQINTAILFFILISTLITPNSEADDSVKWSEVRLYHATNKLTAAPTALNNLSAPDNVPPLDTLQSLGIEIDGQYKMLKVGVKFGYTNSSAEPPNAPFPPPAYLSVSQFTAGLVARVPIVTQPAYLFDAFVELGAADTTFNVQTISSGKATLKKDKNFYQRAGASLGAGSASVKVYAEVGQEWNKINDPSSSGTMVTNIQSVDLSGTYIAFGLIISDVPEWLKPKIK